MNPFGKVDRLRKRLEAIYTENASVLLFHGWHHITFVAKKAREFSEAIGANTLIVESAALVHDLNYIVEVNSEPGVGAQLRAELLQQSGYSEAETKEIEQVIMGAHLGSRGRQETKEVQALSDADTLFKALPITPILFASKYIQQNKVDINKLARKVVSEQKPLLDEGIYFYTDVAKDRYLNWAKGNLQLWCNVEECLKDRDVQELLSIAHQRGVI